MLKIKNARNIEGMYLPNTNLMVKIVSDSWYRDCWTFVIVNQSPDGYGAFTGGEEFQINISKKGEEIGVGELYSLTIEHPSYVNHPPHWISKEDISTRVLTLDLFKRCLE